MSGGFIFSGNSAATPPYIAAAGIPRSSDVLNIGGRVVGPVPSRVEVERAILELQRFMRDLSPSRSEHNGLRAMSNHHELEMPKSPGFLKFSDAFSMMLSQQSLQNLVVSISTDEAVWEAIMSNKAVQNIRSSVSAVLIDALKEDEGLRSPEAPRDIGFLIVRWIVGFTKLKFLEMIGNLRSLFDEIFQPESKEKPTSGLTDLLEEKIRTPLLVSIVILLIVVVTRAIA